MRMFLAAASIILLGFAAPAFSQALADMDYSGRFGGMPPGTVPGAESSSGLVMPFDSVISTSSFRRIDPRARGPGRVSTARPSATVR